MPAADQGEPEPADRTLRDLDDLLGPPPVPGVAVLAAESALVTIEASRPAPKSHSPAAKKPKPAPVPKPDSLFEQDVDELLGIAGSDEVLDLEEVSKAKPVAGMDAMSLDRDPGTITLSSQKATLIVVAAVLLMLMAFITGFAIRATI